MKTDQFDFFLPPEKIAQHPSVKRDASKLLIMDKTTGALKDKIFLDIIDELNDNDCLVLNNTKVIPARLIGNKENTGGTIELLLLDNDGDLWQCLTKPSKKVKEGQIITFGNGLLKAKAIKHLGDGVILYEMLYEGVFLEVLDELGEMPLPPYIYEKLEEKNRYQTVYAKTPGSAAAPTAGFHFTPELLKQLKDKGVTIVEITLHVGLATFRPVAVDDILEHKMHTEKYYISSDAAKALNQAVKDKKRIVAVGTTSIRTLEANYNKGFKSGFNQTDIFIYPGYKFKVVDALITNFHLPKSTLVMLVSAFSTKDYILKAYQHAIDHNYRFFSFGDAMLIK